MPDDFRERSMWFLRTLFTEPDRTRAKGGMSRPSVELAERLRSLRHSPLDVDAHPLCRTRLVTRG